MRAPTRHRLQRVAVGRADEDQRSFVQPFLKPVDPVVHGALFDHQKFEEIVTVFQHRRVERHVLAREMKGVLPWEIGVNPEYLLRQSHRFWPFCSRSIGMQKINYVHVFVKPGLRPG
jgi:hypothetical protein